MIVRFDFVLYYIVYIAFACLLWGITKKIVTGVIGLGLGQYFSNFGAIISNNELDASHYLYSSSSSSTKDYEMAFCCADTELVFNAIIALVMVQPFHSGETLINILCEKLSGQSGDKQGSLRLRL